MLFYFFDKKNISYSKTIYSVPIFAIIYIILGVVFWKNWLDIIPMITATLFTIAYYIKDLKIVRYLSLPPNLMLVVYGIFNLAFTNATLDLIEVFVLIVAIIKFHNFKRNKKTES